MDANKIRGVIDSITLSMSKMPIVVKDGEKILPNGDIRVLRENVKYFQSISVELSKLTEKEIIPILKQKYCQDDEKPEFNILSIEELKNYESPTYKWRVQDLIQDKKIVILAGSSAVYKSWISISLGLSVASGIAFLDNFRTEQGGVLFIDRENSIPELQDRVNMVSAGLKLNQKPGLPMFFLSEQSFKLDNDLNRNFLKNFVLQNNISLIIVDTYRRVIGFEENDANAVSLFFTDAVKPICEETGCSFLFIHHHKNGGAIDEKELLRGSSDLVNFVDGVLQVTRKGKKLTVTQSKNRSGKEIEPFDLEIETDEEESFKFNYLGEKQDISALSRAIKVLSMWFAEKKINQFKTGEAQTICKQAGIKKMGFFSSLSELEKRGIIRKEAKGTYKIVDLDGCPLSTYKSSGQLDIIPSDKSSSPNSPNGHLGHIGQEELQ